MNNNFFKTIFSVIKHFLKLLGWLLVLIIWYVACISFTNGFWQGKAAALLAIAGAGSVYFLYQRKGWVAARSKQVVLLFVLFAYAAFVIYTVIPVAPDTAPVIAKDFPGIQTNYWHLKTGSKIAYYKLPAAPGTVRHNEPIIFLHGGPGAYVRQIDIKFFSAFTAEGYDVYLYDQAGSGRSGLLPKTEYSHERNIRDFQAILEQIGAPKVVLIGQSYGGSLLASIAARPELASRISRAVYAEPGVTVSMMEPAVLPKSPNAADTAALKMPFRLFIGLVINPKGNFVSQEEMINYLAAHETLPENLYRQAFPLSDRNRIPRLDKGVLNLSLVGTVVPGITEVNKDLAKGFQRSRVPSMLILGESSYIERNGPIDLLKINPGIVRTQYLKGVGHLLWNGLDNHNLIVKRCIDEFLNDENPAIPDFPMRKDIPAFLKSRF